MILTEKEPEKEMLRKMLITKKTKRAILLKTSKSKLLFYRRHAEIMRMKQKQHEQEA